MYQDAGARVRAGEPPPRFAAAPRPYQRHRSLRRRGRAPGCKGAWLFLPVHGRAGRAGLPVRSPSAAAGLHAARAPLDLCGRHVLPRLVASVAGVGGAVSVPRDVAPIGRV